MLHGPLNVKLPHCLAALPVGKCHRYRLNVSVNGLGGQLNCLQIILK